MRIGIDVRPLQFSSDLRGIGYYVRELLRGFAGLDSGIEFRLIRYSDRPLGDELQQILPKAELVGLHTPSTFDASLRGFLGHPRARVLPKVEGVVRQHYLSMQESALNRLCRSAKLDLLHLVAPLDAHIGTANRLSVPAVGTFYDAIPLLFRSRYYDSWPIDERKLYDMQRGVFATAKRVVAISKSAEEDLQSMFGVDTERSRLIYPAVDPAFGEPVSSSVLSRARERLGLREPFFLFCAVAEFHKNIHGSIRALARARELSGKRFQMAITGFQVPDNLHAIWGLAFENGLSGKDISLTGQLSADELRALFQSATAVVSPSLYEGFGLPAVQGFLSRTPVLVSNRSSQPEVVGDAGLQVDPEDVDALAEAMVRIEEDVGLREDLVRRGKERAKLFAPERQAEEYVRVYREAL